jgi:single-stranded DNA-binding protein
MIVYDSIKFQGLNKVFLAGTVNEEPCIRQTDTGRIVWRVMLAVPEQFRDDEGNVVTIHTHHIVTAVDDLARFLVSKHIDIGTVLCVDGRLNHYIWTDHHKKRHRLTDVYAHFVQVMAEPPQGAEVYDPPVAPQYKPSLMHEQVVAVEPPDAEYITRFENVIPIRKNRPSQGPDDDPDGPDGPVSDDDIDMPF